MHSDKNIPELMKHPVKRFLIRALAVVVLVIWIFPLYHSVSMTLFIAKESFDKARVRNVSPMLGKEFRFPPFTVLAKMKGYGGWRDEFLYVFAQKPEPGFDAQLVHSIKLNEFVPFTVVELKENRAGQDLCLLENKSVTEEQVAVECPDLKKIEEVTRIYEIALNDIKAGKTPYLAIAQDHPKGLAEVASINEFRVYKLTEPQVLDQVLISYNGPVGQMLHYILDKLPVYFESSSLLDTKHLSYLIVSESRIGLTDIQNHFLGTRIKDESLQLVDDFTDSEVNRWVLYSILIYAKRYVVSAQVTDPKTAYSLIEEFKNMVTCIGKHYDSQDALDGLDVVFKFSDPQDADEFRKVVTLAETYENQGESLKTFCRYYRPLRFLKK